MSNYSNKRTRRLRLITELLERKKRGYTKHLNVGLVSSRTLCLLALM